jgi:hypothetical protein
MVPYSNPAGNNQLTPKALSSPGSSSGGGAVPIAVGASSTLQSPTQAAAANPLIPAGASPQPIATGVVTPGGNVPAAGLVPSSVSGQLSVPNSGSTSNNAGNSDKQLTDIYGQGIGGDINNLLNSIGGTDSATLQEFNQSLQPQEATAQANLNASLGAGGVSANSSVAALGNANLQAQEQATVAGEDAQLTQSGQNLEASILGGTEQAAQAEVSQSWLTDLGDVAAGVGSLAGQVVGAAGKAGGFSNLF